MGGTASPLSIAATGLTAGSKVMAGDTAAGNDLAQGQSTYAQDEFQAQQLSNSAEYGKAQASQTDGFMRQQLVGTLANIAAVRAAANTDPSSPTGFAITNRVEALGDQQRTQKVTNILNQSAADQSASGMYASAGVNALNMAEYNASQATAGGFLGAVGSIFTGLSGLKFS